MGKQVSMGRRNDVHAEGRGHRRRARTTFRRRAHYNGLPSDDVEGRKLPGQRRRPTPGPRRNYLQKYKCREAVPGATCRRRWVAASRVQRQDGAV